MPSFKTGSLPSFSPAFLQLVGLNWASTLCQSCCWLVRIQWGEKTDSPERESLYGTSSPVEDGGHEAQSPTDEWIMSAFSPMKENNMVQWKPTIRRATPFGEVREGFPKEVTRRQWSDGRSRAGVGLKYARTGWPETENISVCWPQLQHQTKPGMYVYSLLWLLRNVGTVFLSGAF